MQNLTITKLKVWWWY